MLTKDLVINEFYKGIADSPHLGIEDMRNFNIVSNPGSATINFKTTALTHAPTITTLAYTATTDDLITVASTTNFYNGMAVGLDTVVTAVGIVASRVYWIGDLTATTFKLYKSPSLAVSSLADITTGGTGTFSTYTLGKIIDKTTYTETNSSVTLNAVFLLDDKGQAWGIGNFGGTTTNNLIFLGNDNATTGNGKAIIMFVEDLVVFRLDGIDILDIDAIYSGVDLDSGSGWDYAVDTVTGTTRPLRPTLVGQDNILYFDNDSGILGSFTTAYVKNAADLDLPNKENIMSLGELGQYLLIGGVKNKVYSWDRVSSSFDFPIILPENTTTRIVTSNQLAYLFTGNRGRIYITNGTSVELYKKISDYISGTNEPYFAWNDAISWRNQLYFSFTASENDGDALTTTGGVWAIDLKTGAFRFTNQLSYGAGGAATIIIPNVLSSTPPGNGLYVGWSNASTYGLDVSSTTYYTGYAAYFISPLFVVETHKNKGDIQEAAITLEDALAPGEGVRISYRKNRSAAWSTPVTFDYATYGAQQSVDLSLIANELVTVQFKIEATGGTTTPKIQEVRIR